MSVKLSARQLRELDQDKARQKQNAIKKQSVFFILENIYDTYNVGGLFRLADALAVEKIYLCGQMEVPPHHKIAKASVGTYKIVPWEYCETAGEAIAKVRGDRPAVEIIAVEQHKKAVVYQQVEYRLPLVLVFGNETFGVLPDTLKLVDMIVEIPMWGVNRSLNVIVAAGIVGYHIALRCYRPAG